MLVVPIRYARISQLFQSCAFTRLASEPYPPVYSPPCDETRFLQREDPESPNMVPTHGIAPCLPALQAGALLFMLEGQNGNVLLYELICRAPRHTQRSHLVLFLLADRGVTATHAISGTHRFPSDTSASLVLRSIAPDGWSPK
jgi:hypothetical protein